jgi:hypothetical protein
MVLARFSYARISPSPSRYPFSTLARLASNGVGIQNELQMN